MREATIRYIIRRLIWLPIYLLIVSVLVFSIGRFGPGDPALVRAGPRASEETIERIRHEMGFDKPVLAQYTDYMKNLAKGDLGESMVYPGRSVKDLIFERIPISAPIGLGALVIALFLGTLAGLLASLRRGTWVDNSLIGTFLFFSSIPTLVFVQFLILLLALKFHLFPAKWSGGWESVFSLQMVIPVLTLSLVSVAGIARLVRTTTLAVLDENYVRMARAKGLPSRVVATKYILRNALLPLVTIVILAIFTLIEGSFFVEYLYGIPGTGQFMITSIFQRDYNVIMGMTMLLALLFVIGNLVADISYGLIDPRVQITKRM